MSSIYTNGTRFDEEQAISETALEKIADAGVAGAVIDFSPEEAEAAGAFIETGLDEQDALESVLDQAELDTVGRLK